MVDGCFYPHLGRFVLHLVLKQSGLIKKLSKTLYAVESINPNGAGQISGAILWYDIDEKVHSFENELNNQVPQPNISQTLVMLNFDTHRVRPYVQAFIGLDWEWCFISKWLSTQLAIEYEVQYFWPALVNPIGSDDIHTSFEGLAVKARIDF